MGIVPGQSSTPVEQITLPVQFGSPSHYRTETLTFVVADFDTAYHAILGRPTLAKLMAIPHYTYLVLKISTEQGVLTLQANLETAYECEQ